MNTRKKTPFFYVKYIIALLAVINLIALFLFEYRLPFFSSKTSEPAVSSSNTDFSADIPVSIDSSLHISVPEDPLYYDGTSDLSLLADTIVVDDTGMEQPDYTIATEISAGASAREKVITYSISGTNGSTISAERTMLLSDNYIGPSIELFGNVPVVSPESIDELTDILASSGLIQALDGFGNDITSNITAFVKSTDSSSDTAVVTLTVINSVGDSVSIDVTVPTAQHGPMIKLNTNRVTLSVGDNFSIYDYIESALAEDGTNLSGRISVEGTVDTSTAGEYTLEFFCSDTDGNVSPHETLTVIVE